MEGTGPVAGSPHRQAHNVCAAEFVASSGSPPTPSRRTVTRMRRCALLLLVAAICQGAASGRPVAFPAAPLQRHLLQQVCEGGTTMCCGE